MGNKVTITTPGTFAFNAKDQTLTPTEANSFVVDADYGMIINKPSSIDREIQLNVGGAIRVGEVNKGDTTPALVQKKEGNHSCVCFGNAAVTQTQACELICSGQAPSIQPACGPNAKNYGNADHNWEGISQEAFCARGNLDPNFAKSFPLPGNSRSWTCEGVGHPTITCTATRYFCGDGVKQAGEACDAGVNNGRVGASCSASCTTVTAPACGANATTYSHTETNWKGQTPSAFCSAGQLKDTQPNFFVPAPLSIQPAASCNKCALKGFPYCFDVSFDPNSEACREDASQPSGETEKNWVCKNENNTEINCQATRTLPIASACKPGLD
ncbi:MAG: hypothetical protein Q4B28_07970, partial [bacterium]|nr:hypothetical protein [bacterium]